MSASLRRNLRVAASCLVLLFGSSAAARNLPKLVVLSIQPIDEAMRKTTASLTEILATDLARTKRFEVMGEGEIAAMIGFDRQRALLGCSDSRCLAEIGGALGCDYLLLGTMGRVGNQLSLDLKIADAKRSRIAARAGAVIGSTDELVSAGRKVLQELLEQVPGGEKVVVVAPLREERASRLGPYLVTGAGGAALLGGAALTAVTLANKSSYTYGAADTRVSAGVAIGALGVAALVSGVVWMVATGSPSTSSGIAVGAGPISGGAGVLFTSGY